MSHETIKRYWTEQKRFKIVHAGRRSFKTELAKRNLIIQALSKSNQNLFFGAPTYTQAKRISWEDLKALTPKIFIQNMSESEMTIKLINKTQIFVFGFDKPSRFEGMRWNGGVLDEYADMKAQVWNQNVMPALRDTMGWCWLVGVPEGRNHYYEQYLYALNDKDNEWGVYNWYSSEIMDKREVEKERKRLDERTFRQEYQGSFEAYEGRAYIYYDDKVHKRNVSYNPNLPLIISCDFNTTPCIWLIGQDNSGKINVLKEIVQNNTDIWKMCIAIKEVITQLQAKEIYFYGDLEHGNNRSVSATSTSWQIIRNEFKNYNVEFKLKSHPRIIDRVNAVNSKLRSADGSVNITINEDCRYLLKDFEMVSLEDLQKSKHTDKDRTHASDCLGYWINYDYPIIKQIGKIF